MSTNYRDQLGAFVVANQSSVAGAILFVMAFSLVTVNAIFNQTTSHPKPLWTSQKVTITNSIDVPVRRVETQSFLANKVPVPQIRPVAHSSQVSVTTTQTQSPIAQILDEQSAVDLTKVQQLLSKLGYYSGNIDGVIGPGTRAAIRAFERDKLLPQSATISPALILLLENTLQANLRGASISETNEVQIADGEKNGALITRIQVGLINFGIPDLSIDGVMGNQTKNAIIQFQKRFNLQVNGAPSADLVKKLESVGALTKG